MLNYSYCMTHFLLIEFLQVRRSRLKSLTGIGETWPPGHSFLMPDLNGWGKERVGKKKQKNKPFGAELSGGEAGTGFWRRES